MKEKTRNVLLIVLGALLAASIFLNGWLLHTHMYSNTPPENRALDGCQYNGQECTCSNTGWGGQCVTECRTFYWGRECDIMFCKCDDGGEKFEEMSGTPSAPGTVTLTWDNRRDSSCKNRGGSVYIYSLDWKDLNNGGSYTGGKKYTFPLDTSTPVKQIIVGDCSIAMPNIVLNPGSTYNIGWVWCH